MTPAPLERIGALSDGEIDLADAALELGALDRPGASLQSYRDHLLRMVETATSLGRSIALPHEQATLLSYVLFRRNSYEGDRATYEDPANANMLDVIDRKRGLPVSLSILYLSIARLAGWHADGLNIPAHFLIRVGDGPDAVLQDPFDQGKQITPSSLELLVRRATGGETPVVTEHLQALSNRAILIRLLNNIAARAERDGNLTRAHTMHMRMTAIAPTFTGLWWERARLEQALGLVRAARASLVAMLETTRSPEIAAQIRLALDGLTRSMN